MRQKKNFTLLELLIALSLFATIMVSLYSALSVGIVAWKRGDRGSTVHQKARIILDTISSDIRNCIYFSYIQFVGKANEVYFPVSMVVREGNKEAKGVFDTNIFKITYLLERKSYRSKYKSLMRKQERFLDVTSKKQVKPKELAGDVQSLSFEYSYKVDENLEEISETPVEWHNEYKIKNKIPMGVIIKLVVVEGAGTEFEEKHSFERTVFIPQGTLEIFEDEQEE
ncbi:prepilin-type N-terminal cleavage/methylation domain-containing protein [bacterium]|nr:prepilin-type N-terminal cleavage/methylation domain-containing protein [bacterium]